MHFPAIILILAFSTIATLGNLHHIRGKPGSDHDDATLVANPFTLDSSNQATNLSPDPSVPVSGSENPANINAGVPALDPTDQSKNLLSDPSSTDSSKPLTQHAPDELPSISSSSQPADDSPDTLGSQKKSLSSPSPLIAAMPWPVQDDGPDCKGWRRLCCYGEIYTDGNTNYVTKCFPCIGS